MVRHEQYECPVRCNFRSHRPWRYTRFEQHFRDDWLAGRRLAELVPAPFPWVLVHSLPVAIIHHQFQWCGQWFWWTHKAGSGTFHLAELTLTLVPLL